MDKAFEMDQIKIKPMTKKQLAKEVEQLREMFHLDPSVKPDMEKTREILSKVDLSGSIILQRHGGDMWEDLRTWITEKDFVDIHMIKEKLKEIEKEYGVG